MKKVNAIVKLITNVISILITFIFGICLMTTEFYGEYESNSSYGGDAYTGIQNAAATTANNVDDLGEFLSDTVHIVGCLGGMLLTVHFIKETFTSIEEISVAFKKKQ